MDIQEVLNSLSPLFALISCILAFIGVVIGIKQYQQSRHEKMGDYMVRGKILTCHETLRKKKNVDFGDALSNEFHAATQPHMTKGYVQRFKGNEGLHPYSHSIYGKEVRAVSIYKSRHGAFGVFGTIGEQYENSGGTNGRYGFPVSNEISRNGRLFQRFEHGEIDA